MTKFFVWANSFAAPFFSDTDTTYVEAAEAETALTTFVQAYSHPAGLYAAQVYASADAYHKSENPLAEWLCNHEIAKRGLTPAHAGYSYLGHGPGDFEIDGVRHTVHDPKGGRLVRRDA